MRLLAIAALLAASALGCARSQRTLLPATGLARSPDGHVAFVRTIPDSQVATSTGTVPATELWIADSDGRHARRLVGNRTSDSLERSLAGLESPIFSPDGKQLYFLSDAWVTSGAVHVVDVKTGRERYLAPGNGLEVIPRGPYAGDLLIEQHRYWPHGGSYDWTWLYTPDGREVGLAASDSTDDALARWKAAHIPP